MNQGAIILTAEELREIFRLEDEEWTDGEEWTPGELTPVERVVARRQNSEDEGV